MRVSWRKRLGWLAVAIIALPWAGAAWARGLDAIILIDQSGSMSGFETSAGVKIGPNDPKALRVAISRDLIEKLAKSVEGNDQVHHVAVVDFGAGARDALPLMVLSKNEVARLGMDAIRVRLQTTISDRSRDRSFTAYTDTPKAFSRAEQIYAAMARDDKGLPPRQQVLLVITDGMPTRAGSNSKTLLDEIETIRKRMPTVSVDVIGIDLREGYWGELGHFWEERISRAPEQVHKADKPEDLPKLRDLVLDRWLGSKCAEPIGDAFTIPDYAREVAAHVHFRHLGGQVEIHAPDGRLLPVESRGEGGTDVMFRDSARPGRYVVVRSPGTSARICFEIKGPRKQLAEPVGPVTLNGPGRILYQLLGARDEPLPLSDGRGFKAMVTVTGPSGSSRIYPAQIMANGFVAVADWKPDGTGQHSVRLSLVDGNGQDLLDSEEKRPDIIDVAITPTLMLSLVEPVDPGRVAVPPWRHSTPIRLVVMDGKVEPASDVGSLMADPQSRPQLMLTSPTGLPLGKDPIALRVDGGTLVGELPVPEGYAWTGWKEPIRLDLVVVPPEAAAADGRRLSGLILPMLTEDHRLGGDPWSLSNFQIMWPAWLRWLAILAATLIFIALGLVVTPRLVLPAWERHFGGPFTLYIHDPERKAIRTSLKLRLTGLRQSFKHVLDIQKKHRVEMLRIRRSWRDPRSAELTLRFAGEALEHRTSVLLNKDSALQGLPPGASAFARIVENSKVANLSGR